MAILLDVMKGSDTLDKISFDLNDFFKNQNISLDVFSSYKLGWLSDMNGKYKYEDGILDICENTLINLEKLKLKVEFLNPDFDCEALWKSWVTFRSKGIYEDTLSMKLENIDSMTFQAIWEYNLGSNISDNDLNIALEQKNKCSQQIDIIFSNYDFLALPSAQVFPFDKNKQFPEKINNINLDTYHRWLEIFILSSLLELPTMTVPVGFSKEGFPMGMQIIARKKDDLKLFAFAKKYEQVFNYGQNKPLLN
jgi:amidase